MGWFVRVCIYSLNRKATPDINRHDKSASRARARAGVRRVSCMFAGFGYRLQGSRVSAMVSNKIKIWLVRGYARDTPPPRHLLCKPDIFFVLLGLSIQGILRTPRVPNRKAPPENQRGPFCEPLGGLQGTKGVYPGRTRSYSSVKFTICQQVFSFLVIFL